VKSIRYATWLALGYLLVAGLYIRVSGRIAAHLARDLTELERLEHIKGSAFVVLTAVLLWVLAWRLFSRLQRSNDERIQSQQTLMLVQSKAFAGELAASVAHDFNNLLLVLGAAIDVADETGGAFDATTLEEMKAALEGAKSLTARLARAARGDRAGRRESLSLSKSVKETTKLVRRLPRLAVKQLELVALTEARASLDPVLIDQILVNLLLNAADACGRQGHVRVEVGENDAQVWLMVEDNGPGLSDSQIPALFEPFRSTKSGGLGLGLLSVRASAEAGDGVVALGKSALGGAKFQVTWPKQARDPQVSYPEVAPSQKVNPPLAATISDVVPRSVPTKPFGPDPKAPTS
jgi:signal transduction histidine kinase